MMNRPYNMYAKGGLKQEGGQKDEVSGNEVPLGGTKEGVRDDIDANLSAGEWVADEATTRYHGLKTFLGMRDEAMIGMKKMEAMGLMGNAEEATLPSDIPFGMADLIVVDIDEENGEEKEIDMARGGMAIGGTIDLSGQQQDVPMRESTPQVTFDEVMADAKIEFKEYRNAEGQSLMVPFIGGVPMYPIPEGYTLYTGEGGETPAVPDVPGTGADDITPSASDDKDSSSIDAYRASAKDTSIDWASLSDEEFLNKANERNGFGRNLAMGVASLINPLAAVGMGALLRYEDMKVLEMAKARLNNIPPSQRAAYEQMIKEYEDRGKGLFGGIINKIIGTVGDMLGLNEEQVQNGSNANLLTHSRNIDTYANPQGQTTQAAIDALNTGNTGTFTTEQYAKANKIIADYQADPTSVDKTLYDTAITNMSNHIGEELGNWVNPEIMNAVQTGGEETRLALVNAVYQNIDGVKSQLDNMSDTQKAFLGYDGTNYRDVVDTLREDASQILPVDTPRLAAATEPMGRTDTSRAASAARQRDGTAMGMLDTSDSTSMPITRDFTADAATVDGKQITTPVTAATADPTGTSTTQFLQEQRKKQVQALIDVGIQPYIAEATVPAASTSFTTPEQTGLEAMEATTPPASVVDTAASEDAYTVDTQTTEAFSPVQVQQPVTSGEAYTGEAYSYPTEAPKTVSSFSAAQQEQDINEYAGQVYGQTGKFELADLEAAGYTGTEIQAFMDQKPLIEQQIQTGVGTVGFNKQMGDAFKLKTDEEYKRKTEDELEARLMQQPVVSDARKEEMLMEQPVGTPSTVTQVTPSQEIQDAVTEEDIEFDAFGTPIEKTTGKELKDIIPETGVTTKKETFDEAFARNRAAGAKTFTFEGKSYTTETAEEAAAKKTETKKTNVTGKYDVTANKSLSAGFKTNTLSQKEQDAFDAAVDRGDSAVADHYASVNRLRNKQDAYAESGFDPAVGASLGLSANDMEQAEKYGGSIQTAINEGRAESEGIFKPVKVTDDSKSKIKTTTTSSSSGSSSTKSTSSSSSSTKSTIKSGDTLSQIAKDNGTTVSELMAANPDITDANKIKAGASINIPKKDSGGGGSSDSGGGGGSSDSGGGGCCFIMLEARYGDGTMDEVVRRYRDEHMTDRNRRGYYKVAEVLVPLMRKSPTIKWLVTKTFADPLVSYGKYYYGQNKHGVLYSPVKSLWMKLFDTVGGDTEFIRENGEVV